MGNLLHHPPHHHPLHRLFLLGAWVLAIPLTAHALDPADIRHLLDRTGFGAEPEDITLFAPLDRTAAVDRVLNANAASPTAPAWALQRPLPDHKYLKSLPEAERREVRRTQQRQRLEQELALKAWWYQWMLDTPSTLAERMTLFWHNHFTSEIAKVRSPQLMLRQNQLFRQHALGNYADLLRAVATDPAMLIYLDGRNSHKAHPNENFARELLELYTLGEGHYAEVDVRNLARALTGWTVHPASGTARFNPRRHDQGKKTLFGQTGHWDLDGAMAILFEQPRTATFLVDKLWRELISPQPDPAEVARISKAFRAGGYELRPMLRELLLTNAFWAKQNRGTLLKSPAELIIGTLRRLELPLPPDRQLVRLARDMGQDLFQPPDVKGWRGQERWIDTNSLLVRNRFLRQIERDLRAESAADGGPLSLLANAPAANLLSPLPDQLSDPTEQAEGTAQDGVRGVLVEAILDPAYHLK